MLSCKCNLYFKKSLMSSQSTATSSSMKLLISMNRYRMMKYEQMMVRKEVESYCNIVTQLWD